MKEKVLYCIVLARSIESHQIPHHVEVKLAESVVKSCPARIWAVRNAKGEFFFFVNNLVTNEKKEWPTKKFDQSKFWLWEFRLSEEILLGINILMLIRGWTGLWSKTRIDVCSVIYGCCCQWHNSQRGKKHLSEQTDRWITWSRWQAVNEGLRWESRWWVSGTGGRGQGGGHNN